ncbi:50S ribosomal protein L23 [Bacilli bacterium]|nr:50S ribosomal protein L23 [Bacilli bacterium]
MTKNSLGWVYDIIISPLMTEKTNLQMTNNKLVLEVAPSATKNDIKKAAETVFSIEVGKVNVITTPGKKKKFKGTLGFRSPKKKAIISLKKGQELDLTKLEIR